MPDHDPLTYLEPDQLQSQSQQAASAGADQSPGDRGLWALRVFVVVVLSAMVIYTFISQLGS